MKISIRTRGEFKLVYFELPTYGVDTAAVAVKINAVAESWNGPETVLFRGQGPVWLYGMLVHSAHATPNCATFEPRKDGYVVVHQHGGERRPGDVIPSSVVGMTIENGDIVGGDNAAPVERLVIAIGGPPHSGKSVFLAELYRQLLDRIPGEVFLQRACPDGEGMWSAESDPVLAQTIRRKGAFTENFVEWVEQSIQGLKRGFKITLLDLGGKRIAPNDTILRNSTHIIVLSSSDEEAKAWVEFGQEHGCEVLAVLASRLVKCEDGSLDASVHSTLDFNSTPTRGEILNLDRDGPPGSYRDAIGTIAELITSMV